MAKVIVNFGAFFIKDENIDLAIQEATKRIRARGSETAALAASLREIVKVFYQIGHPLPVVKANPVRFRFDDEFSPEFISIEDGKISFHFRLVGESWIFDQYILR